MYLTVMIIACIANAIVTIVSFFLYVRTRLTIREPAPGDTDEAHAQRLASLDRREQRYQSIHFITLALFVIFGVLILVHLSGKLNQPTISKAGRALKPTGADGPAKIRPQTAPRIPGAQAGDHFLISVVVSW